MVWSIGIICIYYNATFWTPRLKNDWIMAFRNTWYLIRFGILWYGIAWYGLLVLYRSTTTQNFKKCGFLRNCLNNSKLPFLSQQCNAIWSSILNLYNKYEELIANTKVLGSSVCTQFYCVFLCIIKIYAKSQPSSLKKGVYCSAFCYTK